MSKIIFKNKKTNNIQIFTKHELLDFVKSVSDNDLCKSFVEYDGEIKEIICVELINRKEIKPLIEQFFEENNDLLKSITNDIQKSTDEPFEVDNSVEGAAKMSHEVEVESKMTEKELKEWAKNTPLEALEKFIKESDKPKLREIAHKELARREKEEHVQDKPIKKSETNPFIIISD